MVEPDASLARVARLGWGNGWGNRRRHGGRARWSTGTRQWWRAHVPAAALGGHAGGSARTPRRLHGRSDRPGSQPGTGTRARGVRRESRR
jgi:hypothetical protein